MLCRNEYQDSLTKLASEVYLKKEYRKYLKTHKNSRLIIIDFEKFKYINDLYGHPVGDQYLILFAMILQNTFKNSIIARLHGDEFAILTNLSTIEIEKTFSLCEKKIIMAVQENNIPKTFGFNAGSANAEDDYETTMKKADYMMYYAKNNEKFYQPFSEEVWKMKQMEIDVLKDIDEHFEQEEFTYSLSEYYNIRKEPQNIFQIYTKNRAGASVFDANKYELFRENSKLIRLDLYNIKRILRNIQTRNRKYMICLDLKTLLLSEELYAFLSTTFSEISASEIIFSVNLYGIYPIEYNKVIQKVIFLKKLGFQICLDHYNTRVGPEIWERTDIDYIKYDTLYWKGAINHSKSAYILKSMSQMITDSQESCRIIFGSVENREEQQYLESFVSDTALLSGEYYLREKPLQIEKLYR